MKTLWGDLETYCELPLKDGVFQYAESAQIMLWAYAVDDGPVKVWDVVNREVSWFEPMLGERIVEATHTMPDDLFQALTDAAVQIIFHNAGFDRTVLSRAGSVVERAAAGQVQRWRCTMAQALAHSLPGGLERLCEVLDVAQDQRKLKVGKELVRLFCMPRPKNMKLRRATRESHPEEWKRFVEYADADILAMRACRAKMPLWNYQGRELELFHLDAQINARGVAVDLDFARAAIETAEREQARLAEQTVEITDGAVGSTTQRDALLAHILDEYGVTLPDMQASTLERRVEDPSLPGPVRELLAIRLQAGRNSTSKYGALLRGTNADGRLRGLLQFCGAGRTGRWSGRLFQPQNLARPDVAAAAEWHGHEIKTSKYLKLRSAPSTSDEDVAAYVARSIEAIKAGSADLVFSNVMAAAGSGVRGSLIAPKGRKLVVSDLANIEGRDAAWLAGEAWKLRAFEAYDEGTGPDLYKLAYSKSFNVSPDSVSKPQRQIGKVQELMLQYEGGVGAYLTGALTYGIDLEEMAEGALAALPVDLRDEARGFLTWTRQEKRNTFGLSDTAFIVCDAFKRGWRRAHPAIQTYWGELADTVREAIQHPGVTLTARKLKVRRDGAWLRIGLPSGRALCYPAPEVAADGAISYMGVNQYSRKWQRLKTYGGKLFENVCQAVARDVMAWNMPGIEAAGYQIVLTVHDEVVTEAPDSPDFNADHLGTLLAATPPWAQGMPLAAGGFEDYRYRKD
ncbi:DNA polymerase I [Hydrogenophaga sp.]|uniref:DNA polymerase I n=1 Tax=Hydrogenophaga sp. TaxID=1904254 RepID=UPI0025C02F99|nr:DNA polymerase I [Hydrogenophaga sp.]MBT9467109.1 DNA polymerase I [Hydrogenophaga sp.]